MVGAGGWSAFCSPYRQCSRHRLGSVGSMNPCSAPASDMEPNDASVTWPRSLGAACAIASDWVCTAADTGQAYAETANCVNSSIPISTRQISRLRDVVIAITASIVYTSVAARQL